MKSYLVTYLVEIPEESYINWSEQNDVYGSIMLEMANDCGHMIEVKEVPNGLVNKYEIFDEAGGV